MQLYWDSADADLFSDILWSTKKNLLSAFVPQSVSLHTPLQKQVEKKLRWLNSGMMKESTLKMKSICTCSPAEAKENWSKEDNPRTQVERITDIS